MSLVIVSSNKAAGPDGEVELAAGAHMSMRMWRDETPHRKEPTRSPYETLGYVIAGRADLTIEGKKATLSPGTSYLVPANAEHSYDILETFTAVECTSPLQDRAKDSSHA